MDNRQARPRSPGDVALIALAYGIGSALLAGSIAYGVLRLSLDDCVTVTTRLGEGHSQSVETCS